MNKRKISMMDPGPPPKSPKSKGMAYIEPPASTDPSIGRRRISQKQRIAKEVAELESVEQVKANVQRLNRNKVRLFDLIVRIEQMQARNIRRSQDIHYTIIPDLQLFEYTKKTACPGVRFRYPISSPSRTAASWPEEWDEEEQAIRFDQGESDEFKFDAVSEALNYLEEEHERELEKQRKRDAVLRAMKPEDREAIGMGNWKDPDPDGEAKLLASRVVAVKTRRRK